MKKIILVTALLFIGLYANVIAGDKPSCYVKSGDKIYFGQKLKFGLTTVKLISDNGTVLKVPRKEVISYSNGKRYFELRPTVNKNFEANGYAMMELLNTYNDLKLYRYLTSDAGTPCYEYYVFDKECFHLLINEDNAATVLPLFGFEVRFE